MAIQSDNLVELTGKVVEITAKKGKTGAGKEYLSGKVMLEVGEDCIIPVDFYQNRITKANEENTLYKGFETISTTVKTIAKDGRDEAQIVTISNGNLRENSYYARNGSLIQSFSVSAIAFKEKSPDTELENRFVVSGVVDGIVDEVINDVPTGKVFIDLLVVGYNDRGELIRFTVEDPKAVSYVKNSISKFDEVKLAGELLVSETQLVKREEVAFGAPIEQITTIVQRKLVVTSLSAAKESVISREEIASMLAVRKGRLEEAKEKAANKNTGAAKATRGNFDL